MTDNNWYLYRHLKPCGEVFYIGIGKTTKFKRAYSKSNRNNHWKNKISKYPNYEVQVLKQGLTKSEADEIEIILISWYGREDLGLGTLVNMTNGGDGTNGLSEESRLIKSSKMLGNKNPSYNVRNFGAANPNYGNRWNLEQKRQASERLKGKYTGENSPSWGKVASEYTRNKISENANKPCSCEHYNSNEVINLQTGIISCSAREASETYGFKYSTLKAMLNGGIPNWTNLRYLKDL